MATVATQLRTAAVSNLIAQYLIDMTVTDRGILPDPFMFLVEIGDLNDPKSDRLVRVCTVADLVSFKSRRDTAVRAGDRHFRSSNVVKAYTNINDAVVAKDFLVEQVNALVVEYETYVGVFSADPAEVFYLPMANAGVVTPAINAYVAKAAEVADQTTLVAQKQADCTVLTAEYSALTTALTEAQTSLDALVAANAVMSSLTAAGVAQQATANTLITTSKALSTLWLGVRVGITPTGDRDDLDDYLYTAGGSLVAATTGFETQKNLMDAQLASATSFSALSTAISTAQARVADVQADLAAKFTAKENCAMEVAASQQVLEALTTEAARLLDVVTALCPTYTPA